MFRFWWYIQQKIPLKVCKVLVLLTRKYLRLQENTQEKFFKFVTNRECLFKFSWGICDYIWLAQHEKTVKETKLRLHKLICLKLKWTKKSLEFRFLFYEYMENDFFLTNTFSSGRWRRKWGWLGGAASNLGFVVGHGYLSIFIHL